MTAGPEPAGPVARRAEATRALRVIEEDVFETLEHARQFRERVDPAWPPEDWPPDVTTGDDIRNWLRAADARLGEVERKIDALRGHLLPEPGGLPEPRDEDDDEAEGRPGKTGGDVGSGR